MPHRTPLQPGDPRGVGRYRLAGRIAGIPAAGPIYLAIGPDGAEAAISVLHDEWTRDAAARDRFAAEAAVAKRVPPFCAARVLDAGLSSDGAYLVSEYVPGRSLFEVVSADGALAGQDLEAAAIGMATGLASVHLAGLVHGHFGPELAIMTAAGPRVIEYSITPPYGAATPAGDIAAWAQAVVFAATGRPLAANADLRVLPGPLRGVVADCLHPIPAERPTARAVIVRLLGTGHLPAGVLAEGSRRAAARATPASRGRSGTGQARAGGGPGQARAGGGPGQARAGGGTGRPGQDRPGHQHQARRSRRAVVAGIVLACALLGAGIVRLVQDQGGAPRPGSHPGVVASAGPSAPATVSPSPTARTPASFAGTWSGHVTQQDTTFAVTVSLAAATSAGTIRYSAADLACSGTLTVETQTATQLRLSQRVTNGRCDGGTLTLTLTAKGTLAFSFTSSGPVATGTLSKR